MSRKFITQSWGDIKTAPTDGRELILCDGVGLKPYVGYFERFSDYQLDDDADHNVAGQDLETRRQTLGFWYTEVDRASDGEHGGIGDGRRSPTLWLYMPDSPSEADIRLGVVTFSGDA